MTNEELWKALTEVFHTVFVDDEIEIATETTADDVEDWDSVTHAQLIVAVEERFGVHFSTGEIVGMKNVGEMVALIQARI